MWSIHKSPHLARIRRKALTGRLAQEKRLFLLIHCRFLLSPCSGWHSNNRLGRSKFLWRTHAITSISLLFFRKAQYSAPDRSTAAAQLNLQHSTTGQLKHAFTAYYCVHDDQHMLQKRVHQGSGHEPNPILIHCPVILQTFLQTWPVHCKLLVELLVHAPSQSRPAQATSREQSNEEKVSKWSHRRWR